MSEFISPGELTVNSNILCLTDAFGVPSKLSSRLKTNNMIDKLGNKGRAGKHGSFVPHKSRIASTYD